MTPRELINILEKHLRFVRKREGGVRADLRHANLSTLNLRGVNLQGAILSGADFSNTNLADAIVNLATGKLSRTLQEALRDHALWLMSDGKEGERGNFAGTDFTEVDFSTVNLSAAKLKGCCFLKANLAKSVLVLADLSDARPPEGDLMPAD